MVHENRDELTEFLEEEPKESERQPRRGMSVSSRGLPTFVIVLAIIDLIACVFRFPRLVLSLIAVIVMLSGPQLEPGAWLIIAAAAAESLMTMCGLLADIGILMKKAWAIIPGWVAVVCSVSSVGLAIRTFVGVLQLQGEQVEEPQGTAENLAFYVVLIAPLLFRLVLLGCYIGALRMFTRWIGENRGQQT